jgi:DNA polymerase-3 subunit alpha
MSFDIALTDKLALFVEDMRRGEVECLPPASMPARPPFQSRTARSATPSARSKVSARRLWKHWSPERERKGPFKSLDDFANRIDPRLLNRRQIESPRRGRGV